MSARCSKRNWEPNQPIRSGKSSFSKNSLSPVASSVVRALSRSWRRGLCSLRWVRTACAAVIDTGCWR
ncbi:hypothetical protein SBADM41S_04463 [Streptomyces badius]